MKSLSSYALNIPEEEYHQSKQLSYSILARYEREGGFSSLPKCYDDLWAPIPTTDALTFGAALDAMVTRGVQQYAKEFTEVDIDNVPQKTKTLVDQIVADCVEWMDTDSIIRIMDEQKYYPTWRSSTRINKMIEDNGTPYYDALIAAKKTGARIITKTMADEVRRKYELLKANDYTKSLLFDELPEGQERFFQLQFKANVNGIDFKIMCDLVIVDHDKKSIHIYDLKTSGKESSDFKKSYLDWGYHIQSWLYRIVMLHALMLTDYEDYAISDFSFIVVSKVNDTPLVYDDKTEISHTKPWLRSPLVIAEELASAYEMNIDGKMYRKDIPDDVRMHSPNVISFKE